MPSPRILYSIAAFAAISAVALVAACGGSDPSPAAPGLYRVAGDIGGSGWIDGTGEEARLMSPSALTMDGAGNLLVGDGTALRKISPEGVVTTLGGRPWSQSNPSEGPLADVQFSQPKSIAASSDGSVYLVDGRGLHKITPGGMVTTVYPATINTNRGVAVDAAGNAYLADAWTHVVLKISPQGEISTFAGAIDQYGYEDGPAAQARFSDLMDVTADAAGNVYVIDHTSSNLGFPGTIRKITPNGMVTTLAGTPGTFGTADGTGAAAQFKGPRRIAADPNGTLFVLDDHSVRKITPGGDVTTLQLSGDAVALASVRYATDLVADASGNLYIVSATNTAVKISPDGTARVLAGMANTDLTSSFNAPRDLRRPTFVVADPLGNIYTPQLVEPAGWSVRKVAPGGQISTPWAETNALFNSFFEVSGFTRDVSGNYYFAERPYAGVADIVLGGGVIRRITPAGVESVVAGARKKFGAVDGTGSEARFSALLGPIVADGAGNLYAADADSIRKITSAGVVTTIARDLVDAQQWIRSSNGIAIDSAGNVYVSSSDHAVRKVTAAGAVSVLAGLPGAAGSADGMGAAARFDDPGALAVDPAGNVYVASNSTVRKIATDGAVTTIAGVAGYPGIRLGSLPGRTYKPKGLVFTDARTLVMTSGDAILRIVLPL